MTTDPMSKRCWPCSATLSRCGTTRRRSTATAPGPGSTGQLERYEHDGFGLLAIEDRATSEVIGDCGPTVQQADGESYVELGWHVLGSRQRLGIATEAGAACRDAAFASLDVPYLISLIRPENAPSRRVAEKLGFEIWRGTIRATWGHLIYRLDRSP